MAQGPFARAPEAVTRTAVPRAEGVMVRRSLTLPAAQSSPSSTAGRLCALTQNWLPCDHSTDSPLGLMLPQLQE